MVMMMIKYSMLAALGIVLSSCGGGDLGPTAASGTISQSVASSTNIKNAFDQLIGKLSASSLQDPSSLAGVAGITTNAIKSNAADPEAGCTTITPGTLVDADNDGMVAEKTYTYNCFGIVHGNYTYDKVGTVKLTDDDDVPISEGGGFYHEYDLTNDSDTHHSKWKGNFGLENDGKSLNHYSRFSSTFSEDHNGQNFVGGTESNYTYKLTYNDPVKPYDSGTIFQDGFYRLIIQGDLGNEYGVVDWDFTFEIKAELEYESTQTSGCTYYYKSGYLEFTDESNNRIRYTYTCDSVIYSFNGTEITPI